MPHVFIAIMSSMIRYGELIAGEIASITRVAHVSRAATIRAGSGRRRAVAATAGTLFIRSYERGERVYLAMASRGYGTTSAHATQPTQHAPNVDWAGALALPAAAAFVAVIV